MNFSAKFKINSKLCSFSPDGHFLASCLQNRLRIQRISSLQTLHTFTCVDTIQSVKWSPDSKYILNGIFSKGVVQVWSLEDPKWTCKIEEGSAGLIGAQWSPDSRHILATTEFHLRITVWSLVNKTISYIRHAKPIENGQAFTNDGMYLALAERRKCKDHISIFSCETWQLIKHFECDTKDLNGISWSPRNLILCVWDSLLDYKIILYSLDGHCLASYTAYQGALGIKCVSWSPSGQLLVIGSYDQKARILNHLTWKPIAEYSHTAKITHSDVVVYQESKAKQSRLASSFSEPFLTKCEIVETRPIILQTTKPDLNKPNPKVGVGKASFSHDTCYLATRNDNMSNVIFIWNIQELRLVAVLIQNQPVTSFAWSPTRLQLAVASGNYKLLIWTLEGSTIIPFPHQCAFDAELLKWHPNGSSLLILGKEEFCVCFTGKDNAAA